MQRTKKNYSNGTILTNDPSYTAWGYSIIDYNRKIIDSGCIKTEPKAKKLRIRVGDDFVRRTQEIIGLLKSVIDTYNVQLILAELPHGSQNAKAAKMIGAVPGILETLSFCLNVPIEWYSENDVKKYLCNRNNASKEDIQKEVNKRLYIILPDKKYQREAIADALGIYLLAETQSPILKFLNR